jgi:hypothetical protein
LVVLFVVLKAGKRFVPAWGEQGDSNNDQKMEKKY